jgi:hypothetical protein
MKDARANCRASTSPAVDDRTLKPAARESWFKIRIHPHADPVGGRILPVVKPPPNLRPLMQTEKPASPILLDYATQRPVAGWRTNLALLLAIVGGVLAGYALSFAGFGFFPMWLFFTFLSPMVVCVVTASRHLLVAILSAAAMMGFLLFRVYFPGDGAFAWRLRPDEQRRVLLFVLVLAAISLAIAGAIGAAFAPKRRSRTDGPRSLRV